MTIYRDDELRYWPYCMIHISNRKDSAEACGGPTDMPGQPVTEEDWLRTGFGQAKAYLGPKDAVEIKARLGIGQAALDENPPPEHDENPPPEHPPPRAG